MIVFDKNGWYAHVCSIYNRFMVIFDEKEHDGHPLDGMG